MAVSNDDWAKAEYEELHSHLRSLLDLLQKTANGSFIINPALATGYAYSVSKDHDLLIFSYIIAALGFIFNLGAGIYYHQCRDFIKNIVDHIRIVSTGRPNQMTWLWRLANRGPLNHLTIIYFGILALTWLFGGIGYAISTTHELPSIMPKSH